MAYRWTLTNLSDSSTETLLKDPIGWDEGVYKISRSERYKGAFQEYTTSLKFHCDDGGKQFIDNVYQTEDIQGRIRVLCEYDCDGSGTYDTLFDSIINLASYREDGTYTIVNIEKSDLLTKLNSRDEISVNIESTTSIGGEIITAPNTVDIDMHSMEIFLENEYLTPHLTYDDLPFFVGYIYESPNIFYNVDGTTGGSLGLKKSRYRPKFNMDASSLGGAPVVMDDYFDEDDLEVEYIYQYFEDSLITPSPLEVNWSAIFDGLFRERDGSAICADTAVHTHNFKLILAYGQDWATRTEVTVYDWDTTPGDDDAWTRNQGTNHDETLSVNESGTITLNNNDYVWLYFYHEAEGFALVTSPCLLGVPFFISSELAFQFNDTCIFNLEVTTTFRETQAKTILVHEAFNQVIDSIADSDGNFQSDFYGRTDSQKQSYGSDGCGSAIAITNGLNIREFDDKPIFCTLKELFDTFGAIHNIGLGFESDKIRVEPLAYWFDKTTQIILLPNVNNYETKNDNSRYFPSLEFGYSKWETEVRGGLDEPNTKHEYSTIVNSVKSKYVQKSPYIASSYAIELTRRKNVQNNSDLDDWRYDNDNFLVALVRSSYGYLDGFITEQRVDSFTSGSNMAALETAYNLRLTPTAMLLAHLNVVTAGLQKIQGDISFVRGDGNTELILAKEDVGCQEDYNGQSIAQNDSISWNDANAANIEPIWLPEIYTLDYPITYTQFKAIKANPYGYIEFYKFSGDVKKGFLMNMEYNMKTGLANFTLLKMHEP
jgi:hypothetical protein